MLLNDAKKMIDRKILNVGDVHICCKNCSQIKSEEYIIDKINNVDADVTFDISSLKDGKKYTINYKDIVGISDMSIEDIKIAYEFDVPKPFVVYEKTDVENNVLGKKKCNITTVDGTIMLQNGMKVIFMNDASLKFNQKMFKVSGVNESIKLSMSRGRPKKIR